MMLDAENGLEGQDMSILHLALQRKKGVVLLVNKWDLVEKDTHTLKEYKEFFENKLGTNQYIPILFISVHEKQRVHKAMEVIQEVYEERKKRISTSKLNQVMLKKIEERPPGMERGTEIKIKYITQLPTKTPAFAFFCNLPKALKPSYKRYLENQIRSTFGFKGVPISLVFKKK